MPRYIDIDKIEWQKYEDFQCDNCYHLDNIDIECIYDEQNLDIASIVHAKWIEKDGGEKYMDTGICSNCGRLRIRDKYCGNCGAKMYIEDWQHEEN